jgi:hypothetical protein
MTTLDAQPDSFGSTWKKVNVVPSVPSAAIEKDSMIPANEPMLAKPPQRKSKFFKKLLIGLGVVLLLVLIVGGAAGAVGFTVYQQAMAMKGDLLSAKSEAQAVYDSFKQQDLITAKTHLLAAQEKMKSAQAKFAKLSWVQNIPLAKPYYQDGERAFNSALAGTTAGIKVVDAIEPHADVLGFTGKGTFTGGSTENRVALVLQTLAQIKPVLDDIAGDVKTVKDNVYQIDPQRYPESFRNLPIRQYINQMRVLSDTAELALNQARPVLEQLPAIAGAEGGRKKYLVLFQNNNELRPTGGFLTAYAVVFVENGKVTPEKSDDIYELDKKFRKSPPIPAVLGRFLTTEKRWNLRDMNIDPNFANSMQTFYENYKLVPGEPSGIDGIIAVDTDLLYRVVDILGPIDVPGYGAFSSKIIPQCDCPQIIYALSEIIDRPTPFLRENRKGILAPMMQSIVQKTYATSRDKWPSLANLLWESIQGRHMQMYFFNEKFEEAAKSVNAAGIIPQIPKDSDYLTVIDANLAGAKSNLFVKTSATLEVTNSQSGQIQNKVELTYKNTHAASNCNLEKGELCLNGQLNDWTRWYLPKGAEIKEVLGLENGYKLDTSNADYDVLDGIFRLSPNNQAKVRVTYTVPYTGTKAYKLRMQKQGGTDPIPYSITTPWGSKEVVLDRDLDVTIP